MTAEEFAKAWAAQVQPLIDDAIDGERAGGTKAIVMGAAMVAAGQSLLAELSSPDVAIAALQAGIQDVERTYPEQIGRRDGETLQ